MDATEYVGPQDDELVITARSVGVRTEGPGGRSWDGRIRGVTVMLQANELKVGDVHTEVVVDDHLDADRPALGASGGCVLLHSDEIFKHQVAGFPGILAHGMLTMGLIGSMVTNYVGDGRLRLFGGRFLQQVAG